MVAAQGFREGDSPSGCQKMKSKLKLFAPIGLLKGRGDREQLAVGGEEKGEGPKA